MLALDHVCLARGRCVLVEDLTLALNPGEVLGLLGPNGAGKSTVLAGLCGDLVPSVGTATLDGRPLARWPRADLARRRAVLPQASRIAFSFRVREIVGMGVLPGSGAAPASLVAEGLSRADVAHLAERDYATLSGGEQSRVQLARVLAQLWSGRGQRYLLLDEPTASLDLAHQLAVLELARELAREEGFGVLAILHDLGLAARVADRLALMKDGRLVASGPPARVLDAATIARVFNVSARVLPHPDRPDGILIALA